MINQNQLISKSLFNINVNRFLILFCSSSLLIFSILSMFGGIGVIIFSFCLFIIVTPIVKFFEKLSKLRGLTLGYIFSVNFKALFLLIKLVVLKDNPKNALIINDAAGYIASAFNPNLIELVLNYGIDMGYVFFLKALVQVFNISSFDIPVIFVIPNG